MAPPSKRTTAGPALLPGAGRADKTQVVLHPATLQILEEQCQALTEENATLIEQLGEWQAKAQNFQKSRERDSLKLQNLQNANADLQREVQSLEARRDLAESQRLSEDQGWEAAKSQLSQEIESMRKDRLPRKHTCQRFEKDLQRKERSVGQQEEEVEDWKSTQKYDLLQEIAQAQEERDLALQNLQEVKAAIDESERQVEELTQKMLDFEWNLEDQAEKHRLHSLTMQQEEQRLREEMRLQRMQWDEQKRSYEQALQTNLNDAEGKKAHFQWLTQTADETNHRCRMLEQQAEQITEDMKLHQRGQMEVDDARERACESEATARAALEQEQTRVAFLSQEVAKLQHVNQHSTNEHLKLQEQHARALLEKSNREANALLDAYPESDTDSGVGNGFDSRLRDPQNEQDVVSIDPGSPALSGSLQPSLISESVQNLDKKGASQSGFRWPVERTSSSEAGAGIPMAGAGTGLQSYDQLVQQAQESSEACRRKAQEVLSAGHGVDAQSAAEFSKAGDGRLPNAAGSLRDVLSALGPLHPWPEDFSLSQRTGHDSHASGTSNSVPVPPQSPSSLSSSSVPLQAQKQFSERSYPHSNSSVVVSARHLGYPDAGSGLDSLSGARHAVKQVESGGLRAIDDGNPFSKIVELRATSPLQIPDLNIPPRSESSLAGSSVGFSQMQPRQALGQGFEPIVTSTSTSLVSGLERMQGIPLHRPRIPTDSSEGVRSGSVRSSPHGVIV